MTRLSLSVSGTSPRTMRWARPSTIAVLPTPGSPMSTGLFLVRRDEDLDDAPDLLVAADDRVELARRAPRPSGRGRTSRAPGRCPRGWAMVTRWPPRTVWSAPRIASRRRAVALEELLRLAARLGDAEEQVLRGRVLVAQALRLVLGALEHALRARVERQLRRPGSRARRARIAASSPRNAGRSTPSRRSVSAGIPSSGSTSADSRCSASSTGLCIRSASCWAVTMASWAFSVNRSSCIVRFSLSGVSVSRDQVVARGSGWSTRSRNAFAAAVLRLVVEPGRQDDPDLDVEVAGAVALEARHALAAEPEHPCRPACPAGIVSRIRPLSVDTGTSPPSSASRSVIGQLPLEVRAAARGTRGAGVSLHRDDDVAAVRRPCPRAGRGCRCRRRAGS